MELLPHNKEAFSKIVQWVEPLLGLEVVSTDPGFQALLREVDSREGYLDLEGHRKVCREHGITNGTLYRTWGEKPSNMYSWGKMLLKFKIGAAQFFGKQ